MSLRARLVLIVGSSAAVVAILTAGVTYLGLRGYLQAQLSRSLQADAAAIEAATAGGQVPSAATISADAPGAFVQLRAPGGQVVTTVAATGAGGRQLYCDVPGGLTAAQGPAYVDAGSASPGSSGFRLLETPLAGGGALLVGLPLAAVHRTLDRLLAVELGVGAAAVAAAVAAGWWSVRASLRPLREIGRTASLISAGDVHQRAPAADVRSEVGQVASAFNTMVDRIDAAFARQSAVESDLRRSEARLRRFVADASHELRTPLAAVSAYAELLGRLPDDDTAAARRAVAGISTESSRMAVLVDDLLLLARLDQGRPLERQPVELVDRAAEAVTAARAVDARYRVGLEAAGPLEVLGDPGRLRQVLDNLLANVRSHTPPGTSAVVRVESRAGWAVVEVADDGPGIPEEHLPHVLERFYRAERSRARREGRGAGLGLAISLAIASAHGGHLSVGNAPGGGAVTTLWLPLAVDQEKAGDGR